ncbi:MAG: hypothetical protein AAB582_00800 [Patescibacteria group bacterium]
MMTESPRGFTLLIAVILTSVLVSVGLALVDVTYKQLILASTAKNSQIAFYNADSALECGLYHDQRFNAFSQDVATTSITCNSATPISVTVQTSGALRTSTFSVPCESGTSAGVTVMKNTTGATAIYANGYSSCDTTDVRRIERGLKVTY